MKLEKVIEELSIVAEEIGLKVRKEKGDFRGGFCVKNEEELILLNKRHTPDVHLNVLANCLKQSDLGAVFIKPAVREILEDLWAKQELGKNLGNQESGLGESDQQ